MTFFVDGMWSVCLIEYLNTNKKYYKHLWFLSLHEGSKLFNLAIIVKP